MPDTAPLFRFNTSSRAFLARARAHLSAFQVDNQVDRFFYAALELRFGIEARVTEYLKPALTSIGRDVKDVDDYVASRLLKRLAVINPDYEVGVTIRLARMWRAAKPTSWAIRPTSEVASRVLDKRMT